MRPDLPASRRSSWALAPWIALACWLVSVEISPALCSAGGPGRPGGPARARPLPARVGSKTAENDSAGLRSGTARSWRLADALRQRGAAHEQRIRFTHTAWNASPDDLRGVDVGIAVPASDFRQTVVELAYDPQPVATESNAWGQRTARFSFAHIPPGGSVEIKVRMRVRLRNARWEITDRDVGDWDEIPAEILRQYLRNGERYRMRDERIVRAAQSVHITDGGPLEQIRRVHDYVTDHLDYERDHLWDSAGAVLERGRGSCSEYCYLMIALCRLNGIPARYAGGTWLGGAGSSAAPDGPHVDRVFHRWVEVYLPRIGWFPVDPTENDRRGGGGDGDYYRFFGRIPWSRLTMLRGDGDLGDSGLLGWDYRSGMRWTTPRSLSSGRVYVDRVALWLPADTGRGAPELAALPATPETIAARSR